jgi:hypothetical protein
MQFVILPLLVIWALFLFGGWLFSSERHVSRWTNLASSATLVLLALILALLFPGQISLIIAIGMLFGFVGDLILAKLFPISELFVAGIGAFAVGHISYLIALFLLLDQNHLKVLWPIFAFCWAIALVGWFFTVAVHNKLTITHWLAIPYAVLLASTTAVAITLAWQQFRWVPLALGTGLFLLSDLVVAGSQFRSWNSRTLEDIIWLTYGPAQALIVLTTVWQIVQ